ncbi:MAG: AAA family ATPase, partial [Candidatus Obscuribacterales bacterium]|nr:AAA family ATPase [Candidatus Obscuribacterales bacterium]
GDESKIGDDAQQKLGRETFRNELETALAQGLNVLVDNTNFNQRTRNPVLDRVKRAGYTDVQLLVLDVPLDECLRRNSKRKRVVAESLIRMMHGSLHGDGWPQAAEGKVVTIAPTDDRQIYSVQFPEA